MDIAKIRADTLGCADKLFLNSAGSSLMPQTVVRQMTDYLKLEEQFGGYEMANTKTAEIGAFYVETAALLHCQPKNIAFMYNATDAYSKALSAIPFVAGDSILTTNDDDISNQIAFLFRPLRQRGGLDHPVFAALFQYVGGNRTSQCDRERNCFLLRGTNFHF